MRITFFTHYFPPEVNAPATRVYEHTVRWSREGHEIKVVTCQPNCPNGKVFEGYQNRFIKDYKEVDGLHVTRVWTFIAANAGKIRRSLNFVTYMLTAILAGVFGKRPDIIVATSPQFFCGWAGVIVGKIRRIPVILEIRDVWPASIAAVGVFRNRPLLSILLCMERTLYRWSTHIVTVGDGYRDHIIERMGGNADKVSVITNGVDLEKYVPQPSDESFLHRHDLEGKFVCSYVGTIGMAHRLGVVVKAALKLKEMGENDIRFLMVGDGADRKHVEQLARDAGVTDMVLFLGIQPKAEIPTILASSDVMLVHLRDQPLFRSVIPSKIFEIMAMKRPILIGVDGHARAIVEEAHAGVFFPPQSADALVERLLELRDSPERLADFSEAGRQYVSLNYNRDTLAAEYLELIVKVAQMEKRGVSGERRETRDEKRVDASTGEAVPDQATPRVF